MRPFYKAIGLSFIFSILFAIPGIAMGSLVRTLPLDFQLVRGLLQVVLSCGLLGAWVALRLTGVRWAGIAVRLTDVRSLLWRFFPIAWMAVWLFGLLPIADFLLREWP